jgi:hypothetical protein
MHVNPNKQTTMQMQHGCAGTWAGVHANSRQFWTSVCFATGLCIEDLCDPCIEPEFQTCCFDELGSALLWYVRKKVSSNNGKCGGNPIIFAISFETRNLSSNFCILLVVARGPPICGEPREHCNGPTLTMTQHVVATCDRRMWARRLCIAGHVVASGPPICGEPMEHCNGLTLTMTQHSIATCVRRMWARRLCIAGHVAETGAPRLDHAPRKKELRMMCEHVRRRGSTQGARPNISVPSGGS